MSDYTYNFSAQGSANPWTVPSPMLQLSTANLQVVAGSGIKPASNGSDAWIVHNVAYAGGATEIRAEITVPSLVLASDVPAAGVFVRSGGSAGAGYIAMVMSTTQIIVYRIDSTGASWTDLGGVSGLTIVGSDVIALGYQQSTGDLKVYQNETLRTTKNDATHNADAMGAGMLVSAQNINAQYVATFGGTGVASASAALAGSPAAVATASGTLTPNQSAAPLATISAGAWVPSTGASLPPMVSEAVPDHGTFIWVPIANSACELLLTSLSDPGVSAGHVVPFWASSPVSATLRFRIMQGATQIAQWDHALTPTLTLYSHVLSGAEADAITDYSDLRVRIEAL